MKIIFNIHIVKCKINVPCNYTGRPDGRHIPENVNFRAYSRRKSNNIITFDYLNKIVVIGKEIMQVVIFLTV